MNSVNKAMYPMVTRSAFKKSSSDSSTETGATMDTKQVESISGYKFYGDAIILKGS
jgi:hypothetical protein